MIIAVASTFTLGRFTVQVRPRHDNPAFAVYIVFRGERLIGKNFSRPGLSDCQWLERTKGVYATRSCWPETSAGHIQWNTGRRRGRPRKAEAARELAQAIEGT